MLVENRRDVRLADGATPSRGRCRLDSDGWLDPGVLELDAD